MKKIILKLLCAFLCAMLLAACTPDEAFVNDPTTTAPTTIPTPPPTTAAPTLPPKPQKNPFSAEDFSLDGQWMISTKWGETQRGIDVSAHQGDIDWEKVKAAGVEFAIIRIGFRGYGSTGNLVEDAYGISNLRAAREAGLRVGAYFFSQAVSGTEAVEEAAFAMGILDGFQLDLPLVFDWEYISDTARTANVTAGELTSFAKAFCDVVKEGGYHPMVYFNENYAAGRMDPSTLPGIPFWFARYDGKYEVPYHCRIWQFSNTGKVPGINGNVDLNIILPILYGEAA